MPLKNFYIYWVRNLILLLFFFFFFLPLSLFLHDMFLHVAMHVGLDFPENRL